MDRAALVALGMGLRPGLSIVDISAGASSYFTAVQQVHPVARKRSPDPFTGSGPSNRFSGAEHPSDGWQQTFTPFERILHRFWKFSENRPVRHTDRTTKSFGTR